MFWQASDSRCGGGRRRRAFSLAEMMIALIILGFGLLVIGAALPVGLTYTRKTVERSTGEVAAEYALDVIQQHVRLCRNPLDVNENLRYRTDLFRPRDPATGELAHEDPPSSQLWEPRIKVRPLLPVPIDPADPNPHPPHDPGNPNSPYHTVEKWIKAWVNDASLEYKEFDKCDTSDNWTAPSIPSILTVYPPVASDATFSVQEFFYDSYERVRVSEAARRQALERRVAWVTFYRRVSYRDGSDPNLYEFIAVAVRMSGEGRGFPRQPPPGQSPPVQTTVSPVPWLVTFTGLHLLTPGTDYDNTPGGNRPLNPNFVDPASLRFIASAEVARLLPPGSIFIPAVNDLAPNATPNNRQYAGFVPHAPDALPIYEVEARHLRNGGDYDILVKNNGFYPWLDSSVSEAGWPVWVIPPAFMGEEDLVGPIFENRSPVLAVARRVIWLPEVP